MGFWDRLGRGVAAAGTTLGGALYNQSVEDEQAKKLAAKEAENRERWEANQRISETRLALDLAKAEREAKERQEKKAADFLTGQFKGMDGVDLVAAENYVKSTPFEFTGGLDIGQSVGGYGAARQGRIDEIREGLNRQRADYTAAAAALPALKAGERAKAYAYLQGPREVAPGVGYTPSTDDAVDNLAYAALNAGQAIDREAAAAARAGRERAPDPENVTERERLRNRGIANIAAFGNDPVFQRRLAAQMAAHPGMSKEEAAGYVIRPKENVFGSTLTGE